MEVSIRGTSPYEGSDDNRRGFLRLETGELGSVGTRAYLSYTNQYSHEWKGIGKQKYDQINFKAVQPIGEAKLTAFYNYSDHRENDYQDLSLDLISRVGFDWDNLSGPTGVDSANWALIKQISSIYQANGFVDLPSAYPAPFLSVDDSYFNAVGLRKDKLAGATLNLPFGENVFWV